MSFRQVNLTLDTTAQVLTGGIAGTWNDPPIRQLGLGALSTNSNKIQIGDLNVSSTLFAEEIPVPASSVPYGAIVIDVPVGAVVRLSEIYVKGANGEKIKGWVVF